MSKTDIFIFFCHSRKIRVIPASDSRHSERSEESSHIYPPQKLNNFKRPVTTL